MKLAASPFSSSFPPFRTSTFVVTSKKGRLCLLKAVSAKSAEGGLIQVWCMQVEALEKKRTETRCQPDEDRLYPSPLFAAQALQLRLMQPQFSEACEVMEIEGVLRHASTCFDYSRPVCPSLA